MWHLLQISSVDRDMQLITCMLGLKLDYRVHCEFEVLWLMFGLGWTATAKVSVYSPLSVAFIRATVVFFFKVEQIVSTSTAQPNNNGGGGGGELRMTNWLRSSRATYARHMLATSVSIWQRFFVAGDADDSYQWWKRINVCMQAVLEDRRVHRYRYRYRSLVIVIGNQQDNQTSACNVNVALVGLLYSYNWVCFVS